MPTSVSPEKTKWEQVAETRWGAYTTQMEQRVIEFASSKSGSCGSAIEVGCEGGRWSRLLTDLGWKMTCLDIDEQALRVCQTKVPEARCVLGSPKDTSLPCGTASMRLVLCMEVRPVIQSDWFVSEASRILEPGGILVGMFWNRWSLRGLFSHLNSRRKGEISFYDQAYPPWREKCRNAGFDFLREDGCCWFPLARESNSRLAPFFSGLERFLGLRRLPSVSPWIVFAARKIQSVPMGTG